MVRHLETTAREAPKLGYLREETLWIDYVGNIPFSVKDANRWAPVDLNFPARVTLYKVEDGSIQAAGLHKIEGRAVLMRFPNLRYESEADGLKAILGEPEFIR